jgi:uncharacterized protein YegL
MVLFFIVDTSGSMDGSKIGSVNTAIHDILPELKTLSADNADAVVKIVALEFSSGARWLYDQPIDAETFQWNDLEAGGQTNLGEACKMLNQKLSINAFMQEQMGSFAPVIILLSDGEPTDDNYEKELAILKGNKWFHYAIKIAIAIGEDANKDVLKEFTGNAECVLEANNPEVLRKMIRFASIHTVNIGGKNTRIDVKNKRDEMARQIQESKEELSSIQDIQINTDGWGSND